MSAIPYSQFTSNFKFLSTLMRRPGLLLALWKDSVSNQVCLVAEYSNLDKTKRDNIFGDFLKTYKLEYCLRLLHYTGKKSPSERNLVLIFEHCQTLNDFLVDQRSNTLKSLSIREIVYLFRQVVAALSYIHANYAFHGDIREDSLFIDENNQVKVLRLPEFPTNIMLVRERRAASNHKEANAILLPPELEALASSTSDLGLIPAVQMQQNDIFCLGLLCARLLNPVLFLKAVSVEQGKADINSLINLIDSLEPHLGNEFGTAIRNCLAINPSERTISKNFMKSQADLSASSLLEWDQKIEEIENQPNDRSGDILDAQSGLKSDQIVRELHAELISHQDDYSDDDHLNDNDRLTSTAHELKRDTLGDSPGSQAENYIRNGLDRNLILQKFNKSTEEKPNFEGGAISQGLSHGKTQRTKIKKVSAKKPDLSKINNLKLKCIERLDKVYFNPLSSESTLNNTLGKTYFNLKIVKSPCLSSDPFKMPHSKDTRTIGFIHYPSGDLYFGFVRELCREDQGIHFYANGEIFHGEFRKNKVNGQGSHLYLNGDVLTGHYQEERLDGEALLFVRDESKVFECKFEMGSLVDKTEVEGHEVIPTLMDFLTEGYLQSEVVDTIRNLYLTSQKVNTIENVKKLVSQSDQKMKNSNFKPPSQTHSPFKEALLLSKEELDRFNHAENIQREFFNGYYVDLMKQSPTYSEQQSIGKGISLKNIDSKEPQNRVDRFYAALKNNKPPNYLSEEEISYYEEEFQTKKKKDPSHKGSSKLHYSHRERHFEDRSTREPNQYTQEKFTSPHKPMKSTSYQPSNQNFQLPLKSVRFTREQIEEVGEAAEESSNQVLLNQIDQERKRLKNVLDNIESGDENPVMGDKFPNNRPISEVPEQIEATRLDQLRRMVIRPAQTRQSEWVALVDGEEEAGGDPGESREEGFQQVCFPNGDRFYGEFAAGRAHGKGVYYCADGWSHQAVWNRGRLAPC
jgi:hypothetical protein